MKKEIYKAAASGDVEFLTKAIDVEAAMAIYSNDDLLGLTSHGNNIIHVAAQFGHLDFIKVALDCFPASADRKKLICGTNSEEETPLHFAAKQPTPALAELLITSYQRLFGENEIAVEAPPSTPCRVKNKDGNTPLHVALMNGGKSIYVAAYLLRVDPEVAAYINHLHQTPLHLAVLYNTQGIKTSAIEIINSFNSQGVELSTINSLFVPENEDTWLSLVNSLLKENSEVCCLCDADGMTPLLRAAVRSNLSVVDAIINQCPESIEICDTKGKTVLHYITFPTSLKARQFLEKPELPVLLINQQDHDGNTPMHIAVMNRDFKMVKAMVEINANFSIENKEGASVQNLFDQFATNNKLDVSSEAQIESKTNQFHDLIMENENERGVIKEKLMSNVLYKAVGNGNLEIIREMLKDEEQCLSRLPDGSNIIHLAIECLYQHMFNKKNSENMQEPCVEEEQFIVEALKMYPILFSQTNHHRQTPLHLERFHLMCKIQCKPSLYSKINSEMMNLKGQGELPLSPWKVKDVQGNTILHTAIKHENYEFAEYLIELDASLAGEVNHSKQTPLHLICQSRSCGMLNIARVLLGKARK